MGGIKGGQPTAVAGAPAPGQLVPCDQPCVLNGTVIFPMFAVAAALEEPPCASVCPGETAVSHRMGYMPIVPVEAIIPVVTLYMHAS